MLVTSRACACRHCPETHFPLLFPRANSETSQCCVPQLCSRSSMALSQPASATPRCKKLLPSKLVPCCGNQPHCSCHGKEARRAQSATASASVPGRRFFQAPMALQKKNHPSLHDSGRSSHGSEAMAGR